MENAEQKGLSLENVIATAIQIPGVKVNRELFLRERFQKESREVVDQIVDVGPVRAGISQGTLKHMATKLINERTLFSTGASFAAGLPGGFAMAATIPADIIQFYAVALRMAQELAYLYGEADLWNGDVLENDKVTNQLILYCGVMLGASGAAQAVRLMSSALWRIPDKGYLCKGRCQGGSCAGWYCFWWHYFCDLAAYGSATGRYL